MSPFRLSRTPAEPAPGQAMPGAVSSAPSGEAALVHPGSPTALIVAPPAGAAPPAGDRHDDDGWLGDLLIERGVATSARVDEALLQQQVSGRKLGELLVELGIADERAVADALATRAGVPLVDLRQVDPEPDALTRLPEAVAREFRAVPLRLVEAGVEVALADPFDMAAVTEVCKAVGDESVKLCVAAPSEIQRTIDNAYRALVDVDQIIATFRATEALRPVAAAVAQQHADDDAPIIQVTNLMIAQAMRDRASDVHIEPQADRLRIRFRIDGALHDVVALPQAMAAPLVSRIKIMARMNIVDRRRPQDGQMGVEIDGRPVDIRVSSIPTIWGEKAVLRLLDRNRTLFRLDDLGMPPKTHRSFSRLVRSPYGMVICAGPTGSGKTTTLYATLTEINESERNVMTVEDPVEYLFGGINQIQINEQAGVTFAEGLRSILRQDPDVILVGEIRDADTGHIAVESALTGHFVLSSMHATDACSALERFLDMGIEPFLVASTVVGVVSQRLIRKICRQCRVPYRPGVEELAFYEEHGGPPKSEFWIGEGCNFCSRTGYRDRTGVFEVLHVTDDVKRAVLGRESVDGFRKMAAAQGMRRMIDEGVELIGADVTSISEVMRSLYTI